MNDTPDWVLKEAAKRCAWHPSKTPAQLRGYLASSASFTELCRAIEQHEAFRQEVSDAVFGYFQTESEAAHKHLCGFIISKPKPDPLVEIIGEIDDGTWGETKAEYADRLRAALEARGLEIREKG